MCIENEPNKNRTHWCKCTAQGPAEEPKALGRLEWDSGKADPDFENKKSSVLFS